jgi:2-dehydropantoate 2-reductase
MTSALRIGVMGAGAIGCYVGGCLAADGADVVFVGRERVKKELEASGLVLSGLDGSSGRVVPKDRIAFATDASALADCDVVLCCVKSGQTRETGEQLAKALKSSAIVASLQNGVRNADVLRECLGDHVVLGGIVSFNVVSKGGGTFRRATSGPLVLEKLDTAESDPRVAALADMLTTAGLAPELVADIRPLQWSKLIMNLNNAVGALSDRPTVDLLSVDGYRRILRALMSEALGVLRAAKVPTGRLGPLPTSFLPIVLGLPSPLFRLIASAQVKIDPSARSSMWEDLTRNRPTEVDYLNGEVVRLASECGAAAPLNARIIELVHEAEAAQRGSPALSAESFWSALHAVRA